METKLTLPEEFLDRMKELLQDECEEFVASYDRPRSYGLRRNPLKLDEEAFLRTVPFTLKKVPWAREGYYYDHEQRPGRHPLHEQGIYYIQEPSAMVPVQILDPIFQLFLLCLCDQNGKLIPAGTGMSCYKEITVEETAKLEAAEESNESAS